jgi:hypothetical protein
VLVGILFTIMLGQVPLCCSGVCIDVIAVHVITLG